ncbi:MAG: response regulator [Bdellovibrionota bacterium]
MQYKVLIADDVMFAQRLYTEALRDLPVRCFYAGDGIEAVEMTQKIRPELILMDYRMPRMNGEQAAHRVRTLPEGQHTKILALSTEPAERMRRLTGFDGFLIKPVRLEELACVVRGMLGLHGTVPCGWHKCHGLELSTKIAA